MKVTISYNNKIIVGFAVMLAISGFLVLCGYTISPSFMLACAVMSFSASIVQLIETRIASLNESRKIFGNFSHTYKTKWHRKWYIDRLRWFESVGDIVLYFAVIFSFCLYAGIIPYQNIALADGLTLLTMALLFFDLLLTDRDRKRIRDYKLKHKGLRGGRWDGLH